MNDQRMKSEKRSVLRVLSAILLMFALAVLGLTVSASADVMDEVTVGPENLSFSGITVEGGVYTKVYDGKADAKEMISVNTSVPLLGVKEGEEVTLEILSATFNSANVAEANNLKIKLRLTGKDSYKYAVPKDLNLKAQITPRVLEWSANATHTVTYNPSATVYTIDKEALKLPAFKPVSGVDMNSFTATVVGVDSLPAGNAGATKYQTKAKVALSDPNYAAAPLTVEVTVAPITITNIEWKGSTSWTYGDKCPIEVTAYAGGVAYDVLEIRADNNAAKFAAGDAGSYTLLVSLTDSTNFVLGGDAVTSKGVTILPKKYKVSMNDLSVIGDEKTTFRLTVGGNLPQEVLDLIVYKVNGENFSGTTAFGNYSVTATLPVGNYSFDTDGQTDVKELTAILSVKRQQKIFPVKDENGNVVGNVILANRNGFSEDVNATVVALNGYPKIVKNNKYNQVFKISVTGAADNETFTLIIPISDEVLAPNCADLTVDLLSVYEGATATLTPATQAGKGYAVTLGEGYYQVDGFTGAGETTFVISPDFHTPFFYTALGIVILILIVLLIILLCLYIGLHLRRILDTKQNPVIVIDTDGVLPAYTPVVTEIPDREPVDPDAVIDENLNAIAENLDVEAEEEPAEANEEELRQAVEDALAEAVALNDSADTEDSVELTEETEETVEEEPEEEPVEEETEETVTEELAESIAEELEETVEAEEPEADSEEVEEAVAEAMEEAVAETEEVEEAEEEVTEEVAEEPVEEEAAEEETVEEEPIEEEPVEEEPVEEEPEAEIIPEVVAEDEESDENEDDEESDEDDEATETVAMDDDPFGFAAVADPSTFIDVKENPEAYQLMLERERRGEIRIVSRYKKSFQAKLSQSLGNVQDYYSELKNVLLSFKGVKNRQSWNYEAFNKGRTHVAKMDAKTRSLYLYLAINPEDLVDTKYNFTDVSSKKKYATTPVLMKIKGERKFKHAIELITMLCGDQLQLPQTENEHVDYRVPRMTIEEMVEAGIMKHQAGYIVLIPTEEEAVAVSADVTEEIVAVDETTEAPAEEAVEAVEAVESAEVTEEAPTEETTEVTEETPVEEATEEAEVTEEAPAEEVTEETEVTEEAPVEEATEESEATEEAPTEEITEETEAVEETPAEEEPKNNN